jgi:hypothetical protein
MERRRSATLVVVDNEGRASGVIGPVVTGPPWWQETGPIGDAVPGVTVLRLLHGPDDDQPGSDPTGPMGGEVIYAVELDDPADPESHDLAPWPGPIRPDLVTLIERRLGPQPNRHPWAEPGGPSADLAWVATQVEVTGRPRQHRSWNLSAIWSFPTADGEVWLKCVPPFFAHEAAVLQILHDRPVPRLLAADRHRLLLAPMAGHDGYEADDDEQQAMVDTLVDLQLAAVDRVDQLLAGGVPDLRPSGLTAAVSGLMAGFDPDPAGLSAEQVDRLTGLVDGLEKRLAAVEACGLPDTVVHGDPHGGNCRLGIHPPIWFDWGDSFVGNPILDLAATHRMNEATVMHWIDRWAAAVPGSDPARAWKLLAPIAELRMAWVYQRFLDNIEEAEHVYHRGDVGHHLAAAARLA